MSQAKEIRTKISSIRNTQKITGAMELVAASKMRKAQERMLVSRPYAKKIRAVIHHMAASHSEYQHPYLIQPEKVNRVGMIIVSTDRGLCGGLNVNLFRSLLPVIKQWREKQVEVELCLIGKKAEAFFKRHGGTVVASTTQVGDAPKVEDLIGAVKVMLDRFDQKIIQNLFIVSNEFVNTMSQKPLVHRLVPLTPEETLTHGHWDYIYEPDSARDLLNLLLKRYIESQVYQSVVENIACEQAARMVAMKAASENAGGIIKELRTMYNKARQAGITREISEIVAGAEAVG